MYVHILLFRYVCLFDHAMYKTKLLIRDAPILISVSANISHIFNISTLVKYIKLMNITLALISELELATSALMSVILVY